MGGAASARSGRDMTKTNNAIVCRRPQTKRISGR
jgi:hypothetical protein